jgi:hypothetical protein
VRTFIHLYRRGASGVFVRTDLQGSYSSSSSVERMARRQHCGSGRAARNSSRCVAGPPLAAPAAAGVVVGTSDPAAPGDFVRAGTFVRAQAGSSSKNDFFHFKIKVKRIFLFRITVLITGAYSKILQWTANAMRIC